MLIGLPLAKQEIPHDGKGKRIFSKIGSGELRDINDLVGHMEMNYEEQLTTQYEGIKGGSMSCLGGGWLDLENNNLYKSIIQPYENPINPDEPIFYYHSDHLGSASFLTDTNGIETQELVYLPFGEDWVDLKYNTQQYDTPYKFNGKEKDEELRSNREYNNINNKYHEQTGYNNYGARYYYDWASIWLSVDPMSDKYPHLTSYNYCANNPVMLIDPDGREMDEYKLLQNGMIEWIGEENKDKDILYATNKDGSLNKNKKEEFAYGTFGDIDGKDGTGRMFKWEKDEEDPDDYNRIAVLFGKDSEAADRLFKFADENTNNIEFSIFEFEGGNFMVTTSAEIGKESYGTEVGCVNAVGKVNRHAHNHKKKSIFKSR